MNCALPQIAVFVPGKIGGSRSILGIEIKPILFSKK